MSIARPQLAMPEVLALALEKEQWVIRGSAPLDRVVAAPRLLLLAVDDEHGGVNIEEQPCRPVRGRTSSAKETGRAAPAALGGGGGDAQQKAPECGRVGITRQAGKVLKHTILAQQLCCLDPFQPEDHRIEQREQHFADAVAVVALGQAQLAGHGIFEPDLGQEAVEKIRAAVMGQAPFAKRNDEFPGSSGPHGECYF